MLTRRLIACLDVRDGRVVKGVHFGGLRQAGDPAALARRYAAEGIDELVVLDITATLEGRRALLDTVRSVSRELFVPLTVGGGIRTREDARAVIDAGADKVSINSAALADPGLITSLAEVYGSQAVVVAIDAREVREPGGPALGRTWRVFTRSGTAAVPVDAVAWAKEAESRGAGEILLTSIDRDGTRSGFDCGLTAAVSTSVGIPVIASGGAGSPEHLAEVFASGQADAALAASILHYASCTVPSLKVYLASRGIPVRLGAHAGSSC
jgi:cyclase